MIEFIVIEKNVKIAFSIADKIYNIITIILIIRKNNSNTIISNQEIRSNASLPNSELIH